MEDSQTPGARRCSLRLHKKHASKLDSQSVVEEAAPAMPEKTKHSRAGKSSGRRGISVVPTTLSQDVENAADATPGGQRTARKAVKLRELANAAAAAKSSQGPDSQNTDPNTEARRQLFDSQVQEVVPSQNPSQEHDEGEPDRSDGEDYSDEDQETDPETIRERKRARYTDLNVMRNGLGSFDDVEDMSAKALLGKVWRELMVNNMLTAELILEQEEHNYLLKQANLSNKAQSNTKTSSSKAAADLRGPVEELMWEHGFWLPNGCDAAICKATGTRSVDELKLKNMDTYDIYCKEAVKVALEIRKARNGEARGALQWAFGSPMKSAKTQKEVKEANAMLSGGTYLRVVKDGKRVGRRYSEPRFRAAAGMMFGRLTDNNQAPEVLDLLPAQLAFMEFWASMLLSGHSSIPTVHALRRHIINKYERLRVEIAAIKDNPFLDMSGWQ